MLRATVDAIDDIDLAILRELERNSRQTLAEIAGKVNLSPPSVKRRIDRLEASEVISGYTIQVDHSKLGRPLEAFVELRYLGSTTVDEIAALAGSTPGVEEFFTIAGDPDGLLRLRVESVEHLKRVIDSIRKSRKVTGTKALMVLDSWDRTRD